MSLYEALGSRNGEENGDRYVFYTKWPPYAPKKLKYAAIKTSRFEILQSWYMIAMATQEIFRIHCHRITWGLGIMTVS